MSFFGGGVRKNFFFILICIFSLCFLFSEESQGDKKFDENSYISKVKESMGQNNEKNIKNNNQSIGFLSYLRVFVSLIVILGIIYAIYYFLKKKSNIIDSNENQKVIQSIVLGPGKAIQIVYIAGKYLVLGVTNENINFITEITDEKEIERLEIIDSDRKVRSGFDFGDLINSIFGKDKNNPKEERKFDYEKDELSFIEKQKKKLKDLNN